MKTLLIFCILILHINAKNIPFNQVNHELKTVLNHYKNAMLHKDVDGIVENFYQDIFLITPKRIIKQSLKKAFSTKKAYVNKKAPLVKKFTYNTVSQIQIYDKRKFAIINYTIHMQMPTIKTPLKTEKDFFIFLKNHYPFDKVILNKNKHLIDIIKNTQMVAIKNKGSKWKIIEKEDIERLGFPTFIPNQITSQLTTNFYYQ